MVSVMEMIRLAKEQLENLSPGEVAAELERGEVVLVDVREPTETAGGVIPGALMAPRGMLEFHADPSTKYHIPRSPARKPRLGPGSCRAVPTTRVRQRRGPCGLPRATARPRWCIGRR